MAVGGDHGGWIQFMDLEKKEAIKQVKPPMHVHQIAVTSLSMAYGAGQPLGRLVLLCQKKRPKAKHLAS